jgi:hypothetical protein
VRKRPKVTKRPSTSQPGRKNDGQTQTVNRANLVPVTVENEDINVAVRDGSNDIHLLMRDFSSGSEKLVMYKVETMLLSGRSQLRSPLALETEKLVNEANSKGT